MCFMNFFCFFCDYYYFGYYVGGYYYYCGDFVEFFEFIVVCVSCKFDLSDKQQELFVVLLKDVQVQCVVMKFGLLDLLKNLFIGESFDCVIVQ